MKVVEESLRLQATLRVSHLQKAEIAPESYPFREMPGRKSATSGVDGDNFLRIVVPARQANVVRTLQLTAVRALGVVAVGNGVVRTAHAPAGAANF